MPLDYSGNRNLRGRSFKRQDLTDANFSGADIRGTNFTGAILVRTNFSNAKAGLQKRWAAFLLIVSFVLSGITGFFGGYVGAMIGCLVYLATSSNRVISWIILPALIISFFIIIIRQGLNSSLDKADIFAKAGIGAFAFAFAVVRARARAFTFLFTGFFAGSVAGTLAFVLSAGSIARGDNATLTEIVIAAEVIASDGGMGLGIVAGGIVGGIAGALLHAYFGWQAIKGNEKYSKMRNAAVAFAAVRGTTFYEANLTDANFTGARLKGVDFRNANLTRTCWRDKDAKKLDLIYSEETSYLQDKELCQLLITGKLPVTEQRQKKKIDARKLRGLYLSGSELEKANLIDADFSKSNLQGAILTRANLKKAKFEEADLKGARLEEANLIDADFFKANLQEANFSGAMLIRAKFEAANLESSCLTGSCIQDWFITRDTNIDEIICEYIFLSFNGKDKIDKMPSRGNYNSGEFVLFIKSILDTIDIYHDRDIDPKLAVSVLKQLSKKYDESLDVVAVGNRGEKIFLTVRIPKNINPERIKKEYDTLYKQGNTFYSETHEVLQIDKNVEDKIAQVASSENHEFSSTIIVANIKSFYNTGQFITGGKAEMNNYNLDNAKFGGGFSGTGGTQSGGTLYDYSLNIDYTSKQNLAEVAVEIQHLLAQLQNQGDSQEQAQEKVASDLAKQAQTNPTVKENLIKWGQYVKGAAASGIIGEAAVVVIKLALAFAGITLP
jgi:uncharacterized protein YjbI with pentapeptide repeats